MQNSLLQAEQLYGIKKESIHSVSGLSENIRKRIEFDSNLSQLYVVGELADSPNANYNDIVYFDIRDKESSINCRFSKKDYKALLFELKQGMEILVLGSISLHKRKNQCQLNVISIFPLGEGALWVKYKQTRDKLEKQGLFDEKRKKKIPKLATRIGLIASKGSEAYEDIITKLKERLPFASVLHISTLVQGEYAADEIIRAISQLDNPAIPTADVIIIARGGGPMQDLMCFNDEKLAIAISKSRTPVIAGIGHAADCTIADLAADKRATTPTNAAELAVPDKRDIIERIENIKNRLKKSCDNYLKTKQKEKEIASKDKMLKIYKAAIAAIIAIIILYFIIKSLI